ncbi:MAG TPA: cupredoxin domain-containing protein [Stellaceae bacterium]|nr:cupredoxin domain-containing protein [Stellaceae bacterium]
MRPFVFASLLAVALVAPSFADDAEVTITLKDHQFDPSEVPVPAGVKLKLLVKNDQTVTAEFESNSLHREKIVEPGSTIIVYVGPLDPGSYEFFDDFHNSTRGHLIAK